MKFVTHDFQQMEPVMSPYRELGGCNPDSDCAVCCGTGNADSGGFYPWGEAIFVRCGCTYPENRK